MDDFLAFLLLAFVLLGLPLILSIVALVKSSRTRRRFEDRIKRLEIQGDWLRARLKDLESPPAAAVAEEEPAPPVSEPAAPEPTPRPAAPPPAEEELLQLDEADMTPPEPQKPVTPPPAAEPIRPKAEPHRPAARAPIRPPAPPHKPKSPREPFDWERWIGVRGAALAGGVVLAFAALLFFKYSLDQGWISPLFRVVVGVVAGLLGLVGAELTRKAGYRITSDAISGASVVALYAAFWAAGVRYGLIPNPIAFGLMVIVTAAACALAIRHHSLVIAVLGLIGGFATPLLLSTGEDHPIGLFGYVLLLDLGLLAVARKRRWPSLGMLSLLGTLLMESLWIFLRMGPDTAFIGLIVLGVFAVLFGLTVRVMPKENRAAWLLTQAAGLLLPFGFALYFAARVNLGPHLYPVAILLLLLSGAAGLIARSERSPLLLAGAAVGSVSVIGVWVLQRTLDTALTWELAGMSALLALLFHAFLEWDRRREATGAPSIPAAIAAFGLGVSLLAALVSIGLRGGTEIPIWPFLVAWMLMTALVYRQALLSVNEWLPIPSAALFGFGMFIYLLTPVRAGSGELLLAYLLGVGVLLVAAPLLMRGGKAGRFAWHGAAVYLLFSAACLLEPSFLSLLGTESSLGGALIVGVLLSFVAALSGAGVWHLVAALTAAYLHLAWTQLRDQAVVEQAAPLALLFMGLGVVVATAWPFLAGRLRKDRWALYGAALSGPAWFFGMRVVYEAAWGTEAIALLPLGLGLVSLVAVFAARQLFKDDDASRKRALAWFSAVALAFVTVAIPLQLDKEWITIGWALQGAAVLALWKALDHAGLKYYGLALLTAATARLVANPALLDYHVDMGLPIVNWLAYTYLIPAACLLYGGYVLKPLEIRRARPAEEPLYARGWAVCANYLGLCAVFVVFAWINLAIQDYFSTGPGLEVNFHRMPARDTATSVAWAVYALVLLALGMLRRSKGLRWLSLGFLMLTIGKVFLHDLGELKDLYRVASLLGLAISLILVSFAYQRFVFGKDADMQEEGP